MTKFSLKNPAEDCIGAMISNQPILYHYECQPLLGNKR